MHTDCHTHTHVFLANPSLCMVTFKTKMFSLVFSWFVARCQQFLKIVTLTSPMYRSHTHTYVHMRSLHSLEALLKSQRITKAKTLVQSKCSNSIKRTFTNLAKITEGAEGRGGEGGREWGWEGAEAGGAAAAAGTVCMLNKKATPSMGAKRELQHREKTLRSCQDKQ